MTTSAEPSTPSGSSATQQRRRQITSYKNTTSSPATDTYDRRHGCAQAQPTHATQLYPQLQAVRRLAQTLARYGNGRRGTPISAAPHRERYEHLQPQSDHDRGRVPVPRYATSPRSGGRGLAPQGAGEAAASAEPRGGQPCPDHGDKPEDASDANAGLWLRAAGQRGGAAASGRHRQ